LAYKVMIFAGETSGDMYGGRLAEALRKSGKDFSVSGIGGDAMADAGVELITHIRELSVMGIWEVVKDYRRLRGILKRARENVRQEAPDAVVLVDFYRFNIEIAREAKKTGIPVFYYVAPKLWVWGAGRIRTLRKYVDHILAVFPFEEEYFRSRKMPVTYVGNPLMDLLPDVDLSSFRTGLDLEPEDTVIGILPGSRVSEVRKLLPVFLQAARLVSSELEGKTRFVMPLAHTIPRSLVDEFTEGFGVQLILTEGDSRKVLGISDAAIVASGTATLEAFLLGVPQVVAYRASWLSFLVGKSIIRIPRVSLPNILCGRDVVEEFLQGDAVPENLAGSVLELLKNDAGKIEYRRAGQEILESLKGREAPRLAARAVLEILDRGLEAGTV
jgi:lipid-A-disaccharide synthase